MIILKQFTTSTTNEDLTTKIQTEADAHPALVDFSSVKIKTVVLHVKNDGDLVAIGASNDTTPTVLTLAGSGTKQSYGPFPFYALPRITNGGSFDVKIQAEITVQGLT